MSQIASFGPAVSIIAVLFILGACGEQKHSEQGLEFQNWYVVKPIVAGTGSVSYGKIRNHSGSTKTLTGAEFACAASTALHETTVSGSQVRMAHLPQLDIPNGASAAFEPGHKHIMLGTLRAETTDTCDAVFIFTGLKIQFKIPVKPREE